MNEFKYWFYYLLDDEYNELYAYTDSKDVSSMFESQRDMSKFKKKVKVISRKEVNYLAKEHNFKYLNKYKLDDLEMACTKVEFITVDNLCNNINYNNYICKFCWIPISIYNDELIDALSTLYYDKHKKYISDGNFQLFKYLKANYIGVFIRYYGKTLKI